MAPIVGIEMHLNSLSDVSKFYETVWLVYIIWIYVRASITAGYRDSGSTRLLTCSQHRERFR